MPTSTVRPLSLTLRNGRLAILDSSYMFRYFARRVARWYPGERLMGCAVKDYSRVEYKKSVLYTLTTLRNASARERVIRGNVPSLDTSSETRVAFRTIRLLWQRVPRLRPSLTRPLTFDERLRIFLYESVPGAPLMTFLKQRTPDAPRFLGDAARWLATLHNAHLRAGRRRSLTHERREAGYFRMNYAGFLRPSLALTEPILKTFFRHRQRITPSIQKHARLIHGDFNPNNIIVDREQGRLAVIDFGNSWRYDPLSDLANTVVQLGYVDRLPENDRDALQETMVTAYRRRRPFRGDDGARYALFLLWWSLQTLAFTMTLPLTTRRNIRPVLLRTQRICARAIRTLNAHETTH